MDLVAGLLRQAEAVHADETPARAAAGCVTSTWPAPGG